MCDLCDMRPSLSRSLALSLSRSLALSFLTVLRLSTTTVDDSFERPQGDDDDAPSQPILHRDLVQRALQEGDVIETRSLRAQAAIDAVVVQASDGSATLQVFSGPGPRSRHRIASR